MDNVFDKYDEQGKDLILRAYKIAEKTLEGKTRGNGHPFVEHPNGVARIVANEIGLPAECVAAVYLHEAMRAQMLTAAAPEDGSSTTASNSGTPSSSSSNSTSNHSSSSVAAIASAAASANKKSQKGSPKDDLTAGFPKDVQSMVEGLNKIALIKPKDTRLEAENYKRLIVSYSKDPRVAVLKLADRLEVMRSLDLFPKSSRERKILETLMLYIPLAHQLGLYNMKSEMENIYFRYAEPEQYRSITNKLKATEADRNRLMKQFIEPLKQKLSDDGISYKLKIRTKTAWSIYNKMQKQKVGFDGVYDVFAIRFIIDCEPDRELEHSLCWKVFGYVTEEYESDTDRLRDWISNPKPNGYESLHITVKNKDGAYLEVQIRTTRMDDTAENGLASHWSYKGISHEATLDTWLKSVRNILEHPAEHGDNDEDLPEPPGKEIFVFTPTGELRKLAAGATVLDFAFDIHTNLGIKCTGGLINGKAVSIKEPLHTGDVVAIMSSKNQKPSADWMSFAVTAKARNKIRQKLSEMEFAKASEGKELLSRRLKNWKLELGDEELAALMKKYQHKTINSFYAAVGEGVIDIYDIRSFLQTASQTASNSASAASSPESNGDSGKQSGTASGAGQTAVQPSRVSADDILVIDAKNVRHIDYKMARCCNPVFGDDVFGFVSRLEGIKIHRMSCPNASRLMEMYPYRIQKVKWSDTPSTSSFQVSLKVTAVKEASVIAGIMDVINSFKVSMRSFNVVENDRNGTYEINLKISVPSNLELDKVLSQLRVLKNVMKVSRS